MELTTAYIATKANEHDRSIKYHGLLLFFMATGLISPNLLTGRQSCGYLICFYWYQLLSLALLGQSTTMLYMSAEILPLVDGVRG